MARAGLGWSAEELAQRAAVGVMTVKRFESGRLITPENLEKLRAALIAGGGNLHRTS